MTLDTVLKLSAAILGWVTAIVGWAIAFAQRRKRVKAEAEMKLIRRRGEAPYITPSNATFNILYLAQGEGHLQVCQAGAPNMLCFLRDEVAKETQEGTPVFFVVQNDGKEARRETRCVRQQQRCCGEI